MNIRTIVPNLICLSLIGIALLALGLMVGFNTNKIQYIGATTHHSFEHHSETIGEDELQFTKYPVEIFYSQGGDTGSEVKLGTNIFAATGTFLKRSPGGGFTSFKFNAFIAKGDGGNVYSNSLMVIHPDAGWIELDEGGITNIEGSDSVQKELRVVAELILDNI